MIVGTAKASNATAGGVVAVDGEDQADAAGLDEVVERLAAPAKRRASARTSGRYCLDLLAAIGRGERRGLHRPTLSP